MLNVMIHELTGGDWGLVLRAPLEAAMLSLPIVAILGVPLVFGLPVLFEWARPEAVAASQHLQDKRWFLNVPCFLVRNAIWLAVWSAFALTIGAPPAQRRCQGAAPGRRGRPRGLFPDGHALRLRLGGVAGARNGISTAVGVRLGAAQFLAAFAFAVVFAIVGAARAIRRCRPPRRATATTSATCCSPSRCSGPTSPSPSSSSSGARTCRARSRGTGHAWATSWHCLGLAVLILCFALPFTAMLFRGVKRNPGLLGWVAGIVLLGQWLDHFWLVAPSLEPTAFTVHWVDFAALVALGGLWLAGVIAIGRRVPPAVTGACARARRRPMAERAHMRDRVSVTGIGAGALFIVAAIVIAFLAAFAAVHLGNDGRAAPHDAAHFRQPPAIAGSVELQPVPAVDIARYRVEKQAASARLRLGRRARTASRASRSSAPWRCSPTARHRREHGDDGRYAAHWLRRAASPGCATSAAAHSSVRGGHPAPLGNDRARLRGGRPPIGAGRLRPGGGDTVAARRALRRRAAGAPSSLAAYFHGRPTLLVPAYYGCSNLCGMVLAGVADGLRAARLTAGARSRGRRVQHRAARHPRPMPWRSTRTVLGDGRVRRRMAFPDRRRGRTSARSPARFGFRYAYVAAERQYAHASGIVLVGSDGRVARVLYGVAFPPAALRSGLAAAEGAAEPQPDAGAGATALAQRWLLCFHYDPSTGRYSFAAMNAVRSAGILALIVLAGYVLRARWRAACREPEGTSDERARAASRSLHDRAARRSPALCRGRRDDHRHPGHPGGGHRVRDSLSGGLDRAARAGLAACRGPPAPADGDRLDADPARCCSSAAFVWAARSISSATPPPGSTEIFVVAKQWMWKLQHAGGQREINELHVPAA